MKERYLAWTFVLLFAIIIAGCSSGGGTDGNTTTTDSTPPTNTTQPDFINSGATSTNSTSVTLAISATDNVGVTGHCATESAATPSATDACWQSITSTTSYSASVSYTLSSGDGEKTVYVWFRDAAGNVSAAASDSITLSTTVSGTLFPIATTTEVPTQQDSKAGREMSISAAFDGTNYLVGIQGDQNSHANITAQLVDQSGNLVRSRIIVGSPVNGTGGGAPFVAFDGTNYLMTWAGESDTSIVPLYGQFITKNGNLSGSPFQITGDVANGEGAIWGFSYGGGNYLVVYQKSSFALYGRIISTSGSVGNEFLIGTAEGPSSGLGSVAFDGANFITVWEWEDSGGGLTIKGRFIGTNGSPSGPEFAIYSRPPDTKGGPVSVAFDETNYLVVWHNGGIQCVDCFNGTMDLSGRIVTPSGALPGEVINISTASGDQILPSMAFDGTNYLVTWTDMRNDANHDNICDAGEGTCWDIYGQYISKSGALVGSEFVINADAGNQLGVLSVFAGGKYLVLINNIDTFDGSVGDVYGQFITPTDTSGTGTVTGTVTYSGSKGPVSASRPILVTLSPFLNGLDDGFAVFAINGTFKQMLTLTTSPGTFTFTNVPAGQYHLVVLLDVNNDGVTESTDPNIGDPVEIYTPGSESGSNYHADPATVFTVSAGQTYSLSPSLTFNDTMWAGA